MTDGSSRRHLWPGVPLALGSALLFGVAPPLSKLVVSAVDPLMLAGLLYLGTGIGLALVRLVVGSIGEEGELRSSDLAWLAGAVVLGGIVAPVLLMSALARTSASSAALLLNLEGLATMVIAWIAFRENVDRRLLLGGPRHSRGCRPRHLGWSGRVARSGWAARRRSLPRLGHRQQSDAQSIRRRFGDDHGDQGFCRGLRERRDRRSRRRLEQRLDGILRTPLTPKMVDRTLGITARERLRWYKDGRLPTCGRGRIGRGDHVAQFPLFPADAIAHLVQRPDLIEGWRIADRARDARSPDSESDDPAATIDGNRPRR